jgi:hypothetical protein
LVELLTLTVSTFFSKFRLVDVNLRADMFMTLCSCDLSALILKAEMIVEHCILLTRPLLFKDNLCFCSNTILDYWYKKILVSFSNKSLLFAIRKSLFVLRKSLLRSHENLFYCSKIISAFVFRKFLLCDSS